MIPAASHERLLLKTSSQAALPFTPRLHVDDRLVEGFRTDEAGRFWRFDVTGLKPATEYTLQLVDPDGTALCDAWPLGTLSAPEATSERGLVESLEHYLSPGTPSITESAA